MQHKKSDCPACRLTRVFLLLAVPIMMMMWFKPELPLLRSINLTYAFANLVGLACICVITYKAYQEFWLPARKEKLSAPNRSPSTIHEEAVETSDAQVSSKSNIEANTSTHTQAEAEADADDQIDIDVEENKSK